jgi:hypothetical protein
MRHTLFNKQFIRNFATRAKISHVPTYDGIVATVVGVQSITTFTGTMIGCYSGVCEGFVENKYMRKKPMVEKFICGVFLGLGGSVTGAICGFLWPITVPAYVYTQMTDTNKEI